jgi:hypothetical protein
MHPLVSAVLLRIAWLDAFDAALIQDQIALFKPLCGVGAEKR